MRERGNAAQLQCAVAIETAVTAIEPGAAPGRAALVAGADCSVGGPGVCAGTALLAEVLAGDCACAAAGAASAESSGLFGLVYERSATLLAKVEVIRELNLARRAVHRKFRSAICDEMPWTEGARSR